MPSPAATASFSTRVIRWQRSHGRHGLPWQGTRDAYRIWLSEVMLQQTQVATVLPYFERFVARFPTVRDLACAEEDDVLRLWSGLGYYARARNLHRAARAVLATHGGSFPTTFDELARLPGVGRSTAAAIAAFAAGERRAILDGNVRRVVARHAGIGGDPGARETLARLWAEAEARLPADEIEAYTQGMMDLGASLCARHKPSCLACPVSADCIARLEDRVAELPGARARKPRDHRRIAMLVVCCQGEVLLEKRPPAGIWGGLWSLPEAPAACLPESVAASRWAMRESTATPLAPFRHAFTHFTLEVVPWRIDVRSRSTLACEPGTTWLALDEVAAAALPSPVKKLLAAL